jgi:hypothetical protein
LACASIAETSRDNQTWSEPRYFPSGTPIFASGYCDQPYVVVLPDGMWLCTFTTGAGHEGAGGQHIVATRSQDEGKTWSEPVKIEPDTGPAASWAMPYLTSFGRVYVFYDYNGDKIDRLPNSERKIRDDVLGWYCFKYSDDGGLTWSERHRLPVRTTACDRANQWGGHVHILWGIGKPQHLRDGGMIFGFTKLGRYMLDDGEGWFFRCDNINTEKDPRRLAWKNLPQGEHGVRHPDFGSIQEEHNLVELSDGTLYCVYRTTNGFCAYSTSKDGGATWSLPEKLRYATGEVIPNPRACPRLFKCSNGRFLFWFENNHGKSFDHRNPAWLSGGIESSAGTISWSQPEILIYSDDTSYHSGRFSYPDLIETDGKYWVTSTNKVEARIFSVDPRLLHGLWAQVDPALAPARTSLTPDVEWDAKQLAGGEISLAAWDRSNPIPGFWLDPSKRSESLSLQFTVRLKTFTPNQILFDARTPSGDGLVIATAEDERIQVTLRSGKDQVEWCTDESFIEVGKKHRIRVILDNGPGIIMGLVDGRFCDGSPEDPFGWHRYRDLDAVKNHRLRENRPAARSIASIPLKDSRTAKVDAALLLSFGIYNRALTVSEAVGE